MLVLALCVTLSTPTLAVDNEQPSSWAVDQVNAAIAANLVPQSLQSRYSQAITRAEFCALAVTLFESIRGEITGRVIFADTNDVNVEKMAAIGVVSGVGNNRFAPYDTLTREQAAVMLSRLAGAMGMRFSAVYPSFDDGDNISEWASLEVAQMWFAGIMSGVSNNTFLPKGNYTREQSIITILRLFNAFQLGTVSIIYNVNGGDGVPSDHEVHIAPSIGGDEFGVTWQQFMFTIPDEIPARGGYVFRGWVSDYFPGLDIHEAGELFQAVGIHIVDGLTITLSAEWIEEGTPVGIVTFIFDPNGGTDAPQNQCVEKTFRGQADIRIPDTIPTRPGFVFLGWTVFDRLDDIILPGTFMSISPGETDLYRDDAVTFYAAWAEDIT